MTNESHDQAVAADEEKLVRYAGALHRIRTLIQRLPGPPGVLVDVALIADRALGDEPRPMPDPQARRTYAVLISDARVAGSPPKPIEPGDLVQIQVPLNWLLDTIDARERAELLDLVHTIARHWSDQDGINGSYLDKLAVLLGYK